MLSHEVVSNLIYKVDACKAQLQSYITLLPSMDSKGIKEVSNYVYGVFHEHSDTLELLRNPAEPHDTASQALANMACASLESLIATINDIIVDLGVMIDSRNNKS